MSAGVKGPQPLDPRSLRPPARAEVPQMWLPASRPGELARGDPGCSSHTPPAASMTHWLRVRLHCGAIRQSCSLRRLNSTLELTEMLLQVMVKSSSCGPGWVTQSVGASS